MGLRPGLWRGRIGPCGAGSGTLILVGGRAARDHKCGLSARGGIWRMFGARKRSEEYGP